MSGEALVVQLINLHEPITAEGLEASLEVPRNRPKRFITVERTGGARGPITDEPMLAIQVWAENRYEAVRLAELVADELKAALILHPRVARVQITSVQNYPDASGKGSPRAQVVASVVTTT